MMKNKNMLISKSGKIALLIFLFLFPAFVKAQVDSFFVSDSVTPTIKEAPTEDYVTHDTTEQDNNISYFLKKPDMADQDSIKQRILPDSIVKKMQNDDDFWYANTNIKKEKKNEDKETNYTPVGQRNWFQTLLWIVIIVVFAGTIIWYLAENNVKLFHKKNQALENNAGDDELSAADIFAISYQKEIDKAETGNNYRLAIRLMFLRLLKNMAEKNIIQYKPDKTNLDYLLQLSSTGYYNNFFRITRNYEYSWYGKFEVGKEAYRIIKNDFNQFDNHLK
jgi:hypothetical protein